MTILQLLKTLQKLQNEDFKYYIEWVDIGEEYEYQIIIPCNKQVGEYITSMLNEDSDTSITTEFIVDKIIIDTGVTAYW